MGQLGEGGGKATTQHRVWAKVACSGVAQSLELEAASNARKQAELNGLNCSGIKHGHVCIGRLALLLCGRQFHSAV